MLRDTQKTIAGWIRAPEGVAAAIAEADAGADGEGGGSAARRLADLIRSDAALDAAGRLEIYANAYFHRILGVLGEDYPALRSSMGIDAFHDLVTSYLLVEPSRHPSLRYAGDRLPGFLADHEAASGIRGRAPWAADLARLEWARVDVFDAPDGAPLSRATIASLAPDEFGSLELRLAAWARMLSVDHPVDQLWRSAIAGGESTTRSEEPESASLIVWRKDEAVVHRRLAPLEGSAIALTRDATRFDRLCEWLAIEVGDDEAPAQAAVWLEQWLADGILATPATDSALASASVE
jgi:hypothetical protein